MVHPKREPRLRLAACKGPQRIFSAPFHLCAYLEALKMYVQCTANFVKEEDGQLPSICVEHCSYDSLFFIFDFLRFHHDMVPTETISLRESVEIVEHSETNFESNLRKRCRKDECCAEIEKERKQFNDWWFRQILAKGIECLTNAVRAAHFLYNPYMLRILVHGCEALLLQGTVEHARILLCLENKSDFKDESDWIQFK